MTTAPRSCCVGGRQSLARTTCRLFFSSFRCSQKYSRKIPHLHISRGEHSIVNLPCPFINCQRQPQQTRVRIRDTETNRQFRGYSTAELSADVKTWHGAATSSDSYNSRLGRLTISSARPYVSTRESRCAHLGFSLRCCFVHCVLQRAGLLINRSWRENVIPSSIWEG